MAQFSQEEMFSNILNLMAIMIGVENLEENRQQTEENNVHKANDKQYEQLVKTFKQENSDQAAYILRYMKDRLDAIESKVDAIFFEILNPRERQHATDGQYKPNYISKKEGK